MAGPRRPTPETANTTNVFLLIKENPDGRSITRPTPFIPTIPASSPTSKDLPLNPTNHTHLRLHRPHHPPPPQTKLPIIIYFHGGGFLIFGSSTAFYHAPCERMASAIPAIVVSVDHRLSPESRLPAAYDDAVEAIDWVFSGADPWVAEHGDLGRCFLMGCSSGGNIAYHAARRAAAERGLKGVVFNQPFFGGVERTESEERMCDDAILPLKVIDMAWRLALPEGANRDHRFANPMIAKGEGEEGEVVLPACMVRGHAGDPLIDKQKEFARWLGKGRAARVVERFYEDGHHAVEIFDEGMALRLVEDVKDFVLGC
ncbi:putative carboxylesterase 8 [Acorus gramineus]|uniref:Carboxylesterase 8 n=1 Tax=Acorus gramineus TaxID=55184 RepID=A0AAV9BIE2_ACOGR|nr:putative carboxylesterase 8 [Acorus gramineus]